MAGESCWPLPQCSHVITLKYKVHLPFKQRIAIAGRGYRCFSQLWKPSQCLISGVLLRGWKLELAGFGLWRAISCVFSHFSTLIVFTRFMWPVRFFWVLLLEFYITSPTKSVTKHFKVLVRLLMVACSRWFVGFSGLNISIKSFQCLYFCISLIVGSTASYLS